jgi:hypothetical protein
MTAAASIQIRCTSGWAARKALQTPSHRGLQHLLGMIPRETHRRLLRKIPLRHDGDSWPTVSEEGGGVF